MTAAAPPAADLIPTTLATEPARTFGYSGSVVGLIVAVVSYFLPIDASIKPLIPALALLTIPLVTAELTRLNVFSPATMDRIQQILQGQIDTSTTVAQNATATAAASQSALTAVQTVVADGLQTLLGNATQQATTAAVGAVAAAAQVPPQYPFPPGTSAPMPQPAMSQAVSRGVSAVQYQQWNDDSRHGLR